jgi:hypothetical protein
MSMGRTEEFYFGGFLRFPFYIGAGANGWELGAFLCGLGGRFSARHFLSLSSQKLAFCGGGGGDDDDDDG